MIMKTNDNKKSASLWTQRLFKQTSAWKTAPLGKIYFAHRYHKEHAVLAQFPFSALFADLDNQQINLESTRSIPQGFFEHQSVLSKGSPLTVASNHNCDVKGMLTPIKGLDIASGVTLSTQFTVLNSYNETSDTKTIQLGRLNGQAFDYLPGQYITLSVVIEGKEYKRSYSLASSPTHPGILEITVKRDANGGVVSNWLNDKLTIGDTLNVKGPFGKFSCAKNTPKKILFLAAGSGIVPIMSMLRWLTDTKACVDVMLLLSFQTLHDIIYSEELNLIAANHKNIRLFITLTKELYAPSQLPRLTGRVNQNMLAGLVPDLTERTVYLCGPDVFMNACKQNLLKLKLPGEQLICENFTVGVSVVEQRDSANGQTWRAKIGSYQVQFANSSKTVNADGAMTLLELAEMSGINIGHECRAGSCGECMVKCLKGKVDMTDQAEINDIDRKKGWVYACCAYPSSNVVLDI
jgi:glycine betaine catabolism B